MSAKEIRKLLCEFINSILTDLDAGREALQSVKFSLMLSFVNVLVLLFIWQKIQNTVFSNIIDLQAFSEIDFVFVWFCFKVV